VNLTLGKKKRDIGCRVKKYHQRRMEELLNNELGRLTKSVSINLVPANSSKSLNANILN